MNDTISDDIKDNYSSKGKFKEEQYPLMIKEEEVEKINKYWSPQALIYDPLKAGSIDGTDTIPHDRAISRAQGADYRPNKRLISKPEKTLFVARLNLNTSEETVKEVFSSYGAIKSCKLVKDVVTGFSKGYAFVEFESERSASNAYKSGSRIIIDNKKLLVDYECQRLLPGWIPRRLGGGFGELNGRLVFSIIASAVGSSFQHGYNTGVVNAPQNLIEQFIRDVISSRKNCSGDDCVSKRTVNLIWAFAVSIFCVGGMIGGAFTGLVANKLGRKNGLIYNNILVFIAAILLGISQKVQSFETIILGRLVIGINCGLNAGLAPMYLNEISPVSMRGAVGTVYQLVLTISILISQILGLERLLGTKDLWPVLLAVIIIPAVIMIILMQFCTESPKHVYHKTKSDEEMKKCLTWLRKSDNVEEEIAEIKKEYQQISEMPKLTLKEMFANKSLRIPTIITIVIMISQQFSGINAAMFYSTQMFTSAGQLSTEEAQYGTIGMGTVNVLMTVVSLFLIEVAGRKTLLEVGFGGMAVDTLVLIVVLYLANTMDMKWASWASIVGVMVFVIMFAVGPGSIPWFLINEIFGQSARPMAASIGVTVNWCFNFIVGLTFSPIESIIHQWTFIFFLVCQILAVLFIHFYIPETKQKPISEITAIFQERANR